MLQSTHSRQQGAPRAAVGLPSALKEQELGATDLEWLANLGALDRVDVRMPTLFEPIQSDFVRAALTYRRFLWSCHYAVERHPAVLWAIAQLGELPALLVVSANSYR